MVIQALIIRMVNLFLLISVGFIANKVGMLNRDANKVLTSFVINITTPATIINSVLNGGGVLSTAEVFLLFGLATLSYVVMILLSKLVPVLFRLDRKAGMLYRFMFIFSNVGFMGYPIVSALYGESAVFYAAIFNMPFNILSFSYGVKLISGGEISGFDHKTLLSPCVIASAAAIILYLWNPTVPEFLTQPIGYLADVTVPAAMVIIGSCLAMIPLSSVFGNWRMYLLTVIKLLVVPVILYFILLPLPIHEMIRKIMVVMWSMPIATNSTLLATQYGGDEASASCGVLISTACSLITIPILAWALL